MNRCMTIFREVDVVAKVNMDEVEDRFQQREAVSTLIEVNRYECNLERFCNEPSHIKDADCSFSPWV